NGNVVWATIEEIVQGNETITTLVDNGDGTITYINEEGDSVTIDLADGPQGPAGEDGRSVEDISTVDVLDSVTNEVIETEITFLDGDNTPIGNPVTVYNGKDGEDGQDGATPEIIDGNWWIDGQDTGVAAEGQDGQ